MANLFKTRLRTLHLKQQLMEKDAEEGQSLIFVVFVFIGLLAAVGLGVDLGMFYVERVRAGQAADAAALAAASELPLEPAAHLRALAYLQDNGYDFSLDETQVATNTYQSGSYTADPGGETTIWIDTAYARDPDSEEPVNTANRIRIRVRRQVPVYFLQFIGRGSLPVEAVAEAENISRVDTVIVYDKSGSMEFDTLCYGCWESAYDEGIEYPGGNIFPLHWSDSTIDTADHCAGWDTGSGSYNCGAYQTYTHDSDLDVNDCNYRDSGYFGDDYYTVIEAEEYSSIYPPYDREAWTSGQTFWVMQRNDKGAYYHERDRSDRGAYLSHHPFYGGGVSCRASDVSGAGHLCNTSQGDHVAPQADYDFYAPASGTETYYLWIRGQGGAEGQIFWGMDDQYLGGENSFPTTGIGYDGANSGHWDWECVGSHDLDQGKHTLNLWAGGRGFDVDRVVITTDGDNCDIYDEEDDSDDPPPNDIADEEPNQGRTRAACSSCDPRFAGRPGGQTSPAYRPDCSVDMRQDDLYDDEQPIRGALEAAKHFVSLLDPHFDQIGYVSYSYKEDGWYQARTRSELQCVRKLGPESLDDPSCNPNVCTPGEKDSDGPCDPDCGCFSGVISNTILYELEKTTASGSTNIAHGIIKGHDVLRTGGGHFGRPGAAHIMILMTDGQANETPNNETCAADLWPPEEGVTDDPVKDNAEDKAADCVVHYAQLARDDGIVIYTIALGESADHALMDYVAEITGGDYLFADHPEQLEDRFEELYQRIFLRLTH